jgi:acyl carrier protein phosphodiesterase
MNYLAHAYLSFDNEEILLGNMISDFVKGKKQFDYPLVVQKGIRLHRAIDEFTDHHEATKEAKHFFREHYRLYAGAFIDVAYDHFLASDETEFSEKKLFHFSIETYKSLTAQKIWMPEKFKNIFQYMRTQNWLLGYRTMEGAKLSFGGLVHRAKYLQDSEPAKKNFVKYYEPLGACYREFWKDVKPFAHEILKELV